MKSIIDELNDEQFAEIINNSVTWKEMESKFGYKNSISSNLKEKIRNRCELLNLVLTVTTKNSVKNQSRKDLFDTRCNWQSARSAIAKNARNIYAKHKEAKCSICGYDKHIEVAHIKAVADFDDNATIEEINNINNLIGLCPNHHWEYDNGLLEL